MPEEQTPFIGEHDLPRASTFHRLCEVAAREIGRQQDAEPPSNPSYSDLVAVQGGLRISPLIRAVLTEMRDACEDEAGRTAGFERSHNLNIVASFAEEVLAQGGGSGGT